MMLVFMAFIVTVLSSYKGDSSSGHPTHDPGISWWRLDFSDSCIGWTFSVKMSRYWCCLTTSILQRTIIVLNVKHCSFPVPAVWTNFGICHFDKNRRHTHTHVNRHRICSNFLHIHQNCHDGKTFFAVLIELIFGLWMLLLLFLYFC